MTEEAPYGAWRSPITADLIVSATVRLGQPRIDGEEIYWIESRPQEGGRYVVVRRTADGDVADVNAAPLNARTRVHEYGGGDYLVANDAVYFSNFGDQRLYVAQRGEEPVALTHLDDVRYADADLDALRYRLVCVRESHAGHGEADNTVVAVDVGSGDERVLVQGADFYSSPRVSPDGSMLCWTAWDHPNMPWDGCDLFVGEFDAFGGVSNVRHVAGGADESICQPQWSPDGRLYFVSDRSGWWNLYRWGGGVDDAEALCPMEAEFGGPQWQFGGSYYAFDGMDRVLCCVGVANVVRLASLDLGTGRLSEIETPFNVIGGLHVEDGRAVFAAASAGESGGLYSFDLTTHRVELLKASSEVRIDGGYVSEAEAIEFPTSRVPSRSGERVIEFPGADSTTAFGFYYPPRNVDFEAPADSLPPLIVMSHGGPTAAASPGFSLRTQFWTSRGFAVLDVNYGGSTGYGRAYRGRLRGNWGLVDVADCVAGARYLVERGLVDGARLAITGGSAGGYTTLAALAFYDVFAAGASHYGVSDLEALARDTHKFESRYLDGLIGPYPGRRDLYVERSPVHHTEGLSCPVIFFQGLEDEIVPPNQAEAMVEALRGRGVPVAYLPFEGEQHGFRRSENIKRSLEAELYFYGRIFGFEPADEIEAVVIEGV
jgi:dipeptidyl aminopeptidase/acylaminoacyl peptidase